MAHHHLKASPETCHWGWFDAAMKPAMTIASGDRVTVETVSGAPEDLPGEGYHIPPELLDIHKRSERRMRPFFGVIGVAPPAGWGAISTIQPRKNGGNLDNKELIAGTTLYLPVWTEGGKLSLGDGHGVQGDGEVCVTAIETALEGEIEVHLRKDLSLDYPRAETPDARITMGMNADLDNAASHALRQMIDWIVDTTNLSRSQAFMLMSLAADVRVTQLVNQEKGIHVVLPKSALGAG